MDGVEVGMRFETRKGMQRRYAKSRRTTMRDDAKCPNCGGEAFPGGGCEKDCFDE